MRWTWIDVIQIEHKEQAQIRGKFCESNQNWKHSYMYIGHISWGVREVLEAILGK